MKGSGGLREVWFRLSRRHAYEELLDIINRKQFSTHDRIRFVYTQGFVNAHMGRCTRRKRTFCKQLNITHVIGFLRKIAAGNELRRNFTVEEALKKYTKSHLGRTPCSVHTF